ncbi:hypothetical protein AB4Z16_27815 [Bosea sp. TAF32]
MPERVEPCLALLSRKIPRSDDWSYEVKWDGYRLAVKDAQALGLDSAIFDGEAVVLDNRGAADFSALQKALGGRGGKCSRLDSNSLCL